MYATIRYFNYRKEVSFTILKTFKNFKNADKYAYECAKDDFGEDVVEGVAEQWVYVNGEIESYTKGDGYDRYVYTVIEIPEPEDDSESESDSESELNSEADLPEFEQDTEFDFVKKTNKYEWGFDLTDFNDENGEDESEESTGAVKFQELLDEFDMELVSINDKGFMWENKGSILMVTANNPLTGEYYNSSRQSEKGYLSYVGVSCDSTKLLQEFINAFRSKASYIKGEANSRDYI